MLPRWSALILLPFVLPLAAQALRHALAERVPWHAARSDSSHQAPDPATTPEAVVQAYAARAYGWRGIFGVHTWIALKPAGARGWTRLEVIGWSGGDTVQVRTGIPDAHWYGAVPQRLAELRGAAAAAAIGKLLAAARGYPHRATYRVWPGPNSNTFIAHLGRATPELGLRLPPTAIGKDYPVDGAWLLPAPSGTGWQVSLWGVAGLTLAAREGLELNLFGLSLGIDPSGPALGLPGLGRIGWH